MNAVIYAHYSSDNQHQKEEHLKSEVPPKS